MECLDKKEILAKCDLEGDKEQKDAVLNTGMVRTPATNEEGVTVQLVDT